MTSFSSKSDGHQSSNMDHISQIDQSLLLKLRDHEIKANRLSMAEEVKTLIDQSIHFGVLSTNSLQYPGFPSGSMVGFQLHEETGKPFFVFSSMSAHTKDILADGRVSLTVCSKDFKGAAQGRVVIIGTIKPLPLEDKQKARELYLRKHTDAYWIDFG